MCKICHWFLHFSSVRKRKKNPPQTIRCKSSDYLPESKPWGGNKNIRILYPLGEKHGGTQDASE